MKLLTKAIEAKLSRNPLGSTDGTPVEEKKWLVKFFTPDDNWTWYACEGYKHENGDWEFFGKVESPMCPEGELGYFWLSELQQIRGPFGLSVERDKWF